jgi:hypothetical protein
MQWPRYAYKLDKTILFFVPFFVLRKADVLSCLKGELLYSLHTLKDYGLVRETSVDENLYPWLIQQYPHEFHGSYPFLTKEGCQKPTDVIAGSIYSGIQPLIKYNPGHHMMADKHLYACTCVPP